MRRATNLGFGIIITITGDAPRWATEGGLGTRFETANRRVIASEYAQFAAAVAKRYSGDLPDLPPVQLLLDLERAEPPQLHQAHQGGAAASTATW